MLLINHDHKKENGVFFYEPNNKYRSSIKKTLNNQRMNLVKEASNCPQLFVHHLSTALTCANTVKLLPHAV